MSVSGRGFEPLHLLQISPFFNFCGVRRGGQARNICYVGAILGAYFRVAVGEFRGLLANKAPDWLSSGPAAAFLFGTDCGAYPSNR